MTRLVRALASAMIVLGLCSAVGTPTMAASQVTLRVYVRGGVAGGTLAESQWEKKVFAEFEKENPDIKLEIVTPSGSDYLDKLTLLWTTGDPPDVWDHGGAVATYVSQGWLLDLMPYVKRDLAELKAEDFFSGAWRAYQWGGHFWGMPFLSMPYPLLFNADLFEGAGLTTPPIDWDDASWTWDRLVEYARKLFRVGADGRVQQLGVVVRTDGTVAPMYSWLWGGDWFDRDTYETSIPNKCTVLSRANELAYQKLVELARYGVAVNGEAGFWSGKVGMVVNDPLLDVMNGAIATQGKIRWGIAAIPRGTQPAALLATDPWMVSSKTKHPEAAWRFIKYITSQKVMESYTTFGVAPVARASALPEYLNRASKLSGYQSARDVLTVLAGGQKYGREAYDHVISGWRPWLEQVSQRELPAMLSNQRSVSEVLTRIQEGMQTGIANLRKK